MYLVEVLLSTETFSISLAGSAYEIILGITVLYFTGIRMSNEFFMNQTVLLLFYIVASHSCTLSTIVSNARNNHLKYSRVVNKNF